MPLPEVARLDALIVDDDPDIRSVLAERLYSRGLVVATAADGRAGVDALKRSAGRYRLVFSDINMPGADGFAVLDAARQANPTTYVVMMTGFASLDTAITAVRSGAQDYLTKPFSLGQIDVIVERATSHKSFDAEQRRLAHQGGSASLAAIESRLASIERTLAHIHALVISKPL